jgi:hypothetical protein
LVEEKVFLWAYSFKISGIVKCTDIESKIVVSRCLGEGGKEDYCLMGIEV